MGTNTKLFIFRIILVLVDLALVNAGYFLTFLLRYGLPVPRYNIEPYLVAWPLLTLSALGLLYFYRLYSGYRYRWAEIFAGLLCVVFFQALAAIAIAFYLRGFSFPRLVLMLSPMLQLVLLAAWRRLAWHIERGLMVTRKVLVVGSQSEAVALAEKLESTSFGIIQVIGLVLDCLNSDGYEPNHKTKSSLCVSTSGNMVVAAGYDASTPPDEVYSFDEKSAVTKQLHHLLESRPVLGDISSFCECLDSVHLDEVFVCAGLSLEEKAEVLYACAARDVRAYLVPDFYEILVAQSRLEQVDDLPVFAVSRLTIPEEARLYKRAIDITFSLAGLLLFAPFMVLIALAVRLDSPGPIFYRQQRLTENGKPFNLYKFRTMIDKAESATGPVLSGTNDPRITRVGRILRATRLDELPQLINVLRGEMSLVGPRPERSFFIDQLVREVPEYVYRMNVKSGITGLAQVAGRYSTSPECKLMYDLLYTRSYSPARDIAILMQTLKVILMKDRAS